MQIFCAFWGWLIDPDNITAVSTVVIAAFTGVLAAVSICQGRLIRKDFIATHRPRVVVRYIGSPNHSDNGRQSVSITVANIGSSRANISEWGADLARWTVGNDQIDPGTDTPRKITPITLVSGDRHTFTVIANLPYGDKEIFQDATEDVRLCIFGRVRYLDGNNIVRETGFFRVYDEASKSFVPSEHKDREYQD